MKWMEGIRLVQKRMHLSPPTQIQHFYWRLLSPGVDSFLALAAVNPLASEPPGTPLPAMAGRSLKAGEFPRTGGNPVEFAGTAIFKDDKMVGMLTVDETAGLLSLRGEMGKVYASVPDPMEEGKWITLRIHQENKPQYRASFLGNRPVLTARLQFEGEILSSMGKTDYSVPENRRKLEQFTAKHRERTIFEPLIEKVYKEWGADPVGLGQLFRTRFPTFDDWLAYRWSDHIRDLELKVETELLIRRFGLIMDAGPTQHSGR